MARRRPPGWAEVVEQARAKYEHEEAELERLRLLVLRAAFAPPPTGLVAIRQLLAEAQELRGLQIRWARAIGLSWAAIGRLLGVSRQALWQEGAPAEHARRARARQERGLPP